MEKKEMNWLVIKKGKVWRLKIVNVLKIKERKGDVIKKKLNKKK